MSTDTPEKPPVKERHFGFEGDPEADGFGEIGRPEVGGRFVVEVDEPAKPGAAES